MKAVRLHEYGGPENLCYEDGVPEPVPAPDQVLVDAWATSVNPIDWKIRSGARQKDFPRVLPAILGMDVSGVVRAVGSQVRNFKTGDRVFAMADATYAEQVVVPEAHLAHLPDGVELVDAAALPLACLTADQLVREVTQVRGGQSVLISGALGAVGRAAVHVARKLGARVIAGVRGRQLDEARGLGVDDVLAMDDESAIAALPKVDAVVDTVGGETAARLFERVKDGGRLGYASVLPPGVAERNPSVTIARVFARPDAARLREFADDVRHGSFSVPVARRMPLAEAASAHVMAERGGAGKIVLMIRRT